MAKAKTPATGTTSGRKRVTLVATVGSAKEVVATGDFTSWSVEGVRLKNRPDGTWAAALQLPPGEYQYRLRVDGRWENNPAAERRAANAFGSENDILTVS
jgi:Glycogen recognition site of AMP-activated protein kinase